MNALLTGATGFVGGRLLRRLLDKGFQVRALSRGPRPDRIGEAVEWVPGHYADAATARAACAGMDAVFHVAAKAGVWGSRESYETANWIGARTLLDAARAAGVRYYVYTSTPSVVFNRGPFRGEDESIPYGRRWLCDYARTKALAEGEVLRANSETFRTVALRPHLVWGAGDPHLLPRVVASALAGRLKIVGNGSNRVDLTHVDNVVEAHLRAFAAIRSGKACGKAYFLSDGEPVLLWPWLNDILERLGQTPIQARIPLRVAYTLGGACELAWKLTGRDGEPPMTRFVAIQLGTDHFFDTRAARRELAFEPKPPGEAAMNAALRDLKARLELP